jgi:hypothetical protein
VNALWRRLTGTRVMRSAAAECGPPPAARHATALAELDDLTLIRRGHEIIAARLSPAEVAHGRVVAELARHQGTDPQPPRRITYRPAEVTR